MKKKIYCFNCDCDVLTIEEKQRNTYSFHKENFKVEETIYKCSDCGNELIGANLDDSLKLIYDKYLSKYNLNLDSFKKIRKSFNLSQELFAKALGWSKKTINRYENQQSIPQKEYLNIYKKLQDDKDAIINILNQNKDKLGEDYYKIIKNINTDIDIKTLNAILYILDKNPLYETQIMKYCFAIDFENHKNYANPITNLKYARAPHGPIIDKRDALLNTLVQNKYLRIICVDDDKTKFISTEEYDLSLFNDDEIKSMNAVKDKFKDKATTKLSEWSHKFKGWKETANGDIIPYKYAKYFDLNSDW